LIYQFNFFNLFSEVFFESGVVWSVLTTTRIKLFKIAFKFLALEVFAKVLSNDGCLVIFDHLVSLRQRPSRAHLVEMSEPVEQVDQREPNLDQVVSP
jgi:hypothetical protein